LRAPDPREGVLEQDGVKLPYVRDGKGPPIAVIGSAKFYSRAFSRVLRRHFEMTFADSRHFVPSWRPSAEDLRALSLQTLADDVEALRVHLGIDRWAVLGHSVHAQIALQYAVSYPQAASHLVMVAGLPYVWAELEAASDAFWLANASPARKEQHATNRRAMADAIAAAPEGREAVTEYIANAAYYWADPAYDGAWLWGGVEFGAAAPSVFGAVPSRAETRHLLESAEPPMLLVLGQLDYAVPHTAWEDLISGLPRLTYVLLKQAGHNPQTEAPDRFDAVLVEWLARH
jgi:proline iminopeptidase